MRITWDAFEDRSYSSGVHQGVLYPEDSPGVAWNGLIAITEREIQVQESKYVDGRKYHNRNYTSGLAGTISAFTYPDELEPYIGISGMFTEQDRRSFGLSYRADDEIHIVYNILAAPSKQQYASISEVIDLSVFEWDFTTKPEKIPGGKPASHIVILPNEIKPNSLSDLENRLYGDDLNEPSLPSVDEILDILESSAVLRITDNGDGSWTAIGPDDVVSSPGGGIFTINYSTVIIVDSTTFRVSSL
jgi:hypothetical protein